MEKSVLPKALALMMALFVCGATAMAQGWSQTTACPGWNNPSSFTAGGVSINKYSGAGVCVGSSTQVTNPTGTGQMTIHKPCPDPLTANTGALWIGNPPYSSTPNFNYTASQLASVQATSPSMCSSIPNVNNQFLIITDVNGHDPNTGNHLPYVPTQFNTVDTMPGAINTNITRSIRIGDGCASGTSSNGYGGAALYYTMMVTPDNAMMYIYYAIVAQAPTHGQKGNPTFIIRVMKKNASGAWTQISDTLAYYVSTTPSSNHTDDCDNIDFVTMAAAGQTGWHSQGDVYYKDWDKVCLNLTDYLYDTLQIQVIDYDCVANYHYAYGYIAGECRSMTISSSGCPAGMDTNVTVLTAAQGLKNYVWYASEYGIIDPPINFGPGQENGYVTWRRLTPETNPNGFRYGVSASDFRVTRRLDRGVPVEVRDSSGNRQTFRCKVTSAIDPAKPFDSYLYVQVQNTKPTMDVDTLFLCDGNAKLWNRSFVPGDPTLVVDSTTRWEFYTNSYCLGQPFLVTTGDSAMAHFDGLNVGGVRVTTYTTDPSCYSQAIYPIKPRQNPWPVGMTISSRVLCDADATTLSDTNSGIVWRSWSFRPENAPENDMTLSDVVYGVGDENRELTRSFSHSVEPIELKVRNGLYYLTPTNITDTVWCETIIPDTVSVFVHPELEVSGDTVVCQGSSTDATVRALGVDGCTYEWSLTLGTVTGGLPTGAHLQVVPYADTATYFVKVTSPQGCVAWDSIHAYMVKPKLFMSPTDGRVCPGVPAQLWGTDADHYSWTASPSDPSLAGQERADTISVTPSVTTTYTMVGHGTNDCNATPLRKTVTIVPLPIPRVITNPAFVDSDNPKVTLRDVSTHGVASSWLFNDGTTQEGREVVHYFANSVGLDSVHVTLTSFNELQCPTVYPFAIPVNDYTAWFPTIFTPGSNDGNGYFSLYTINDYQFFHIYIYNRRGELVFESESPDFRWDGTKDGEPCPQGAYVYICRFRKPGTTTLSSLQGSITLIR